MRLRTLLAATLLSAAIYGIVGSKPVYAETQNQTAGVTAQQPKFVEVKPGDYLAKIAQENGTTYPRLYDANPKVSDPNLIYPGDKLRVPANDEKLASRTPAPAAAPVAKVQPKAQVATRARATARPAAAPAANVSAEAYGVWDRLAQCESGGNWSINTGNGYYGGLQFSLSSWRGVGGAGYPHQASRDEQIARAKMLQARQGWGAWPACTLKLGIR